MIIDVISIEPIVDIGDNRSAVDVEITLKSPKYGVTDSILLRLRIDRTNDSALLREKALAETDRLCREVVRHLEKTRS